MKLIEKLKDNIRYHMLPYNLGDKGETVTLIMELIRAYEATQQVKCLKCAGTGKLGLNYFFEKDCDACAGTGMK